MRSDTADDGQEFRNEFEFRLFGLRRSGNHAIVCWIAHQFDEPAVFLNDVIPGKDPFDSRLWMRRTRVWDVRGSREWLKRLGCVDLWAQGIEELRGRKKTCLMHSYEDRDIRSVGGKDLPDDHDRLVGKSRRVFNLLLLRDPYNWVASRIFSEAKKGHRFSLGEVRNLLWMWKCYAMEFARLTGHFRDLVPINFDSWFAIKEYRKNLCSILGLHDSEAGLHIQGGSSSFESAAVDARDLGVMTRWRTISCGHLARAFDDEVTRLSSMIFGGSIDMAKGEVKVDSTVVNPMNK